MGFIEQFTDIAMMDTVTAFVNNLDQNDKDKLLLILSNFDEYKNKLLTPESFIGFATIDGRLNLFMIKKKDLEFSKKPTIIDIENVIDTVKNNVND